MSDFFFALAIGCGVALVGLAFATLIIAGNAGPTNWMALAIIAWSALAVIVLGALFLLASWAADSATSATVLG